jgi:hypothetical protein
MAFYLPPDGPLADMLFEEIEGELRADLGDEGIDVMQKVREALVGAGLGMHAEGPAGGSTRRWVGLDETGREMARQLTTATRSFEWSNVVTDETMMAFRVATRPERIWEEIKSAMPAEDRREMESNLKMAQTALGGDFDFERDVVGKLSGQVGLVVYEIGGMGAMMQAGSGNPAGALEKIKAGFLLQFEDAAAAEKLMDTAKQGMAAAGMSLSKESADGLDGATVYSVQRPAPISIYHDDGALFVVPGPMEASKVASILGGEETKLDGMGQRFVEPDHVNGFYLDANRIKAEMGEMAAEQMKNWKAMALYSYVDDAGAWVELNWELEPGAISEDGGE